MVRLAAELFHAALDVGVEALAVGERSGAPENHFCGLRGELASPPPTRRPARRPASPESGGRYAHFQIFALVIRAYASAPDRRKSPDSGSRMKGVLGEGVPQPRDDVIEFASPHVALVVLHVIVEAEVERRVGIGGRDDIPAGAPAADVIERGEAARDMIRRIECGRGGRNEPMRSVAPASADNRVNGSNDVTVPLRFSALIGMLSTARWSAIKKASNLPRSSVCAKRFRC